MIVDIIVKKDDTTFMLTGNLESQTADQIVINQIFTGDIEADNSPYTPVDLDAYTSEDLVHESIELLVIKQYFVYRQAGMSTAKSKANAEEDKLIILELLTSAK